MYFGDDVKIVCGSKKVRGADFIAFHARFDIFIDHHPSLYTSLYIPTISLSFLGFKQTPHAFLFLFLPTYIPSFVLLYSFNYCHIHIVFSEKMGFCGIRVPQNPSLPIPHHLHTTHMRKSLFDSKNDSAAFTSISAASSPCVKLKLGKRWKEYQGLHNWEGLLDPLDDNLRNEILRYGQFVDAAYKSFDFDPSSPSYATCLYPKASLLERSGLPSTGYRVSKHLRATSGIRLPGWVHKAPSVAANSSWIGYVAVCHDKQEISRLGRRDVVIAFRGTATCLEWLENLRATLTKLPSMGERNSCCSPMAVESGFLSLYTSETDSCPSLRQMVREEISRLLQSYGDQSLSLTITGHSLGAALATLAAYDIKEYFKRAPMVTVMSFGGPRVGNSSFRKRVEKQGTKVLRIVNSDDVITKVPGFVVKEEEGGNAVASKLKGGGVPRWIQKCAEDTQWAYSEVGRELRLSSRDSPHLTGINAATCHDLNTYLHLVDGFVSSSCPFRATARRILR